MVLDYCATKLPTTVLTVLLDFHGIVDISEGVGRYGGLSPHNLPLLPAFDKLVYVISSV